MTAIEQLILTNQIAIMLAIRDLMSRENPDFKRQTITLTKAVIITENAIESAEAKE